MNTQTPVLRYAEEPDNLPVDRSSPGTSDLANTCAAKTRRREGRGEECKSSSRLPSLISRDFWFSRQDFSPQRRRDAEKKKCGENDEFQNSGRMSVSPICCGRKHGRDARATGSLRFKIFRLRQSCAERFSGIAVHSQVPDASTLAKTKEKLKGTGTFFVGKNYGISRRKKGPRPLIFQSGFTLIELLVVIGIIAMLIGILLPALGRARETSKRVACLSNLHQMAIAAQTYVNNYKGSYPPAYWEGYADTTTYHYCWDLTTVSTPVADRVVLGLLWDGSGNQKIQQCPSFDGPADFNVDPYTGYNYNTSYIGHGQWEAIPAPIKASQIRNSARVALFGDGQYGSGANKFMRAPFPNPGDANFSGRYAGAQGYRHQKMTNVAYCDGHADSQLNRYTSNADGANFVTPHTGFLSPDNAAYAAP
jgi:prepilin-type N-terminal cleavage/methylation domain-containing protein/prepilin-type processing-associated H-X9-DG protein